MGDSEEKVFHVDRLAAALRVAERLNDVSWLQRSANLGRFPIGEAYPRESAGSSFDFEPSGRPPFGLTKLSLQPNDKVPVTQLDDESLGANASDFPHRSPQFELRTRQSPATCEFEDEILTLQNARCPGPSVDYGCSSQVSVMHCHLN
jgi:hypothetical protein